MTHDPDHNQRARHPDTGGGNGLHDPRLSQAYRDAQRGPQEEVPWELRGTSRPNTGPRSGPSTTTRVVIALVLVAALIVPLIGRW